MIFFYVNEICIYINIISAILRFEISNSISIVNERTLTDPYIWSYFDFFSILDLWITSWWTIRLWIRTINYDESYMIDDLSLIKKFHDWKIYINIADHVNDDFFSSRTIFSNEKGTTFYYIFRAHFYIHCIVNYSSIHSNLKFQSIENIISRLSISLHTADEWDTIPKISMNQHTYESNDHRTFLVVNMVPVDDELLSKIKTDDKVMILISLVRPWIEIQ